MIWENVYVPKPNTRIQLEKDRDIERIDSAVNKIEASGDSSTELLYIFSNWYLTLMELFLQKKIV